MKYQVKVNSKEKFQAVIALMAGAGKRFNNYRGGCTPKKYTDDVYERYPYPIIGDKTINATRAISYPILNWPEDITKIIDILFCKEYKVENVGDHDATITPDGIEVGCQTISFDKFNEVVEMVKSFKENQ